MTEAEWPTCTDVWKLSHFLHGKVKDRQWRLFAHNCCSRLSHLLTEEPFHSAIQAIELRAEGRYSDAELTDLHASVRRKVEEIESTLYGDDGMLSMNDLASAWNAISMATSPVFDRKDLGGGAGTSTVGSLIHYGSMAIVAPIWQETQDRKKTDEAELAERLFQARVIKDIVYNPFRTVPFDSSWRTESVVGLARGIYDDRAFDRLPVLADALEDAGCDDAEVLGHCRGDGFHVRGCWLIDTALGKS